MKFEVVLFDLDGTLIDPYLGISDCILHVLEHFGDPPIERDVLVKFIGPPLIDGLMTYAGYDEEKARAALKIYRRRYAEKGVHEYTVTKGMFEVLEKLRERSVKMAVATLKPDVMANAIMTESGLGDYFSFIAGADLDPDKRNNKRDIILYALENMGISPEKYNKVLMVGDRHHDIEGAQQVGVASAGLLTGYGSREELSGAGADFVIDTIFDLPEIVL